MWVSLYTCRCLNGATKVQKRHRIPLRKQKACNMSKTSVNIIHTAALESNRKERRLLVQLVFPQTKGNVFVALST